MGITLYFLTRDMPTHLISVVGLVVFIFFSFITSKYPKAVRIIFSRLHTDYFLDGWIGPPKLSMSNLWCPQNNRKHFFFYLSTCILSLFILKYIPRLLYAIFPYYVTWYWVWNVYSIDTTQNLFAVQYWKGYSNINLWLLSGCQAHDQSGKKNFPFLTIKFGVDNHCVIIIY